MSTDLDNLRKQIEEIDEQIIKLIISRFELVKKVGEFKRNKNLPVTDEKREEEVRQRWILLARRYGLSESFVETFLPILFSYSKLYEINSAKKRRIVLLGYGGMARSLASLFKVTRQEVVITGRDLLKAEKLSNEFNFVTMDILNALRWGELIISTFPPSVLLSDFSSKIYSNIKGKIFMDISSSKKVIFPYIEEKSLKENFTYISIHPLFGPYLYPVGEKIVIIPSKSSNEENVNDIIKFFRDNGLNPVKSTLEEHEKAMAIVQVLPHFYLLALSESIEKLSKELDIDFSKYQTTNFREVYKIIKKINDIKNVILEIQNLNPYADKARELGITELNNLYNELSMKKK
ncbi:chorismate mutase [Acidianus sulfidivorans JP7]|uniref:Chorismate mutase n=1 Tax=Acidianus sulfidivorans JP7 TaxID=619593 RepID=A0A2U9INM6_9CREN|nr:chorismate mutase [Acidianus sulfidivorans]AWR97648.1 chorismate mutase [Acidianus sulfidivorans JP7]